MMRLRTVGDRNLLLDQLRKAVTLQIELWDARLALSEGLERTADDLMAQHTIATMTFDTLLKKHRNVIALESALRDAVLSLCSSVGCELAWVIAQVEALSITADSGLELSAADLDEFLGLGEGSERMARAATPITIQ
jgi:hypothetical protein